MKNQGQVGFIAKERGAVFVPGGAVPQDVDELLDLAVEFERMSVDGTPLLVNPNAALDRAQVLLDAACKLDAQQSA